MASLGPLAESTAVHLEVTHARLKRRFAEIRFDLHVSSGLCFSWALPRTLDKVSEGKPTCEGGLFFFLGPCSESRLGQ